MLHLTEYPFHVDSYVLKFNKEDVCVKNYPLSYSSDHCGTSKLVNLFWKRVWFFSLTKTGFVVFLMHKLRIGTKLPTNLNEFLSTVNDVRNIILHVLINNHCHWMHATVYMSAWTLHSPKHLMYMCIVLLNGIRKCRNYIGNADRGKQICLSLYTFKLRICL